MFKKQTKKIVLLTDELRYVLSSEGISVPSHRFANDLVLRITYKGLECIIDRYTLTPYEMRLYKGKILELLDEWQRFLIIQIDQEKEIRHSMIKDKLGV